MGLGLHLARSASRSAFAWALACCVSKLLDAAIAIATRPEPTLSLGMSSKADGL